MNATQSTIACGRAGLTRLALPLAEGHRCLAFVWRAMHERGSSNRKPSLDRANHQDDLAAAFTETGSWLRAVRSR
jgi:hypothetical protein